MNRSLAYKLGAMALLMVILVAALARIGGVIGERQAVRDQVVLDIARSSSLDQLITGPILVVPFRRTLTEWHEDTISRSRSAVTREVKGQLYFLPEVFRFDGKLHTERRARGIYEVRLYHADNQLSGHIELPAKYGIDDDFAAYHFETPFLSVGISDIRGIANDLAVQLNGQSLKFIPGSGVSLLGSGVHVPLAGVDGRETSHLEFAIALQLQGTSQFHVTPVGRETVVTLSSDWPHPGFTGDYLPTKRSVASTGFNAQWQTSFFSTNLEEALRHCSKEDNCSEFHSRHFGVSFVDPVDQYLKSDRAIKYALLFIALTFAGFFLFEVLKKLAIHPVQYGLVGAALALFYLLLLSMSEHIDFAIAYLVAATACIALIGFYVGHVLESARRGAAFATSLAVLYGLLFGLITAEDYALLMGAILLFALLTAVMILTRRVNWFSLSVK